MTEQEQWLADQRLQQELDINKVPYAKARYAICKQCDDFLSHIMVCKICYCFMPGKTILKSTECPLGKWGPKNE